MDNQQPNKFDFDNPRFTRTSLEEGCCLIIDWSCEEIGFGQLIIAFDHRGKPYIDTEYMGRDFALQVLKHFIETIPAEYDPTDAEEETEN